MSKMKQLIFDIMARDEAYVRSLEESPDPDYEALYGPREEAPLIDCGDELPF